jgi:hypothetical protein
MGIVMGFLGSLLPPKTAALIDYRRANYRTFFPFGGPFNGQTFRAELIRALIQLCKIEQIVETGTYRGTTTEWFAQFGLPVFSAEISARMAAFSRLRLTHWPNVRIENAPSTTALREWSADPLICSRRTLFYLDAHWMNYLPLREEIEIISARFKSFAIVIDDFRVAGDDAYRYDDYGPGKVLELDYLKPVLSKFVTVYFPSLPGKRETGARRGCVLLTNDEGMAEICDQMPSLQRVDLVT